MLNLTPIFERATEALRTFGDAIRVRPLPTVVFMMQCDVVNQYRHAITHYLPISLSEHYLQNSSHGSPYDKWRKFTNEDFELLGFAIHNLIRYTSRLVYESIDVGLQLQKRFREIKSLVRDDYTAPLCEMKFRGMRIGVEVLADHQLQTTPFSPTLTPTRIDIYDRSVITGLCDEGQKEIIELAKRNLEFGQACREFQKAGGPIHVPFDGLNETWWT